MSDIVQGNLGPVTAYAYAKAGGYTGTENEFQALMAANVDAAQYAEEVMAAAEQCHDDKEAAALSATSASGSADAAEASKDAAEVAANYARAYTGAPRVAATAAAMTDHALIYVYTGSETGYTAGNWYYWDGTAWASGGVYNSTALETDDTLTISGAAADAKATGDAVGDLRSALNDMLINVSWVDGGYISSWGNVAPHGSYKYTDYIQIGSNSATLILGYDLFIFRNTYIAYYNSNKNFISGWSPDSESLINVRGKTDAPEGAYYVRFSCYISYDDKIWLVDVLPKDVTVADGAVTNEKIANGAEIAVSKLDGEHDPATNFINPYTIKADTYIYSDGNEITSTNIYATDFIPLNAEQTYYYGGILTTYYAFYDENKSLVASYSTLGSLSGGSFTVPSGAYFGRFTIRYIADDSYYIFTSAGKPPKFGYIVNGLKVPIENGSITADKLANEPLISISQLNFTSHYRESNYIPQNADWLENSYINESGGVSSYNALNASPYIELEPETTYYRWSGIFRGYYAFYDANKTLIEGHGNDGSLRTQFTTPANTAYIRVTVRNADGDPADAWIALTNEEPAPYGVVLENCYTENTDYNDHPCDYDGNEIIAFTNCLCIGDSLTAGTMNYYEDGSAEHYIIYDKYSYPRNLERLTNLQVTNKGRGGYSSAEWYDAEQNTDLSGYDIAIIQLGVNDQFRYGEFGTTSITAFTNIINKLKTENKNIKIFIANIIPGTSFHSAEMVQFSADLLAWVTQLNQTDPNVIPLDMQQYGHTMSDIAYNCGHLSAFGYWRLAQDYKNYISYYISTHKELFREIQFIGTNYYYDPTGHSET